MNSYIWRIVLICCGLIYSSLNRGYAAESTEILRKVPVVLSTDVGNEIDDQWAIAYLFTNPAFNVLGVISAHAPSLPDPSSHSTYLVLRDEVEDRLGLKVHPPLFEGSSLALQDARTPRPNDGTKFLIAASQSFGPDHRLVVLTIGAATDVASAILEDPSIANRIKIVAMAFSNDSAEGGKEYNVQNDIAAWQVLLHSNVPITIGSGDICRKSLALNLDEARRLIELHGAIGTWLWEEFRSWYYRNVKPLRVNDFSKPWIIWDMITLAEVEGFTTEKAISRPTLGDDLSLTFSGQENSESQNTYWITSVDSSRLWADFVRHLDGFQRSHAIRGESGGESNESLSGGVDR